MKILGYFEQRISIDKIILLPILVGFIPNIIYVIFFLNDPNVSAILIYFALLVCGFTGVLMIHYKKIPWQDVNPRLAVLIGLLTSALCWITLILFMVNDLSH
jgi:hypothetical protein